VWTQEVLCWLNVFFECCMVFFTVKVFLRSTTWCIQIQTSHSCFQGLLYSWNILFNVFANYLWIPQRFSIIGRLKHFQNCFGPALPNVTSLLRHLKSLIKLHHILFLVNQRLTQMQFKITQPRMFSLPIFSLFMWQFHAYIFPIYVVVMDLPSLS